MAASAVSAPRGGRIQTAFGVEKARPAFGEWMGRRECAFLEAACERAEFPVQAGNDLRAEGAGGRNARDRPRKKPYETSDPIAPRREPIVACWPD